MHLEMAVYGGIGTMDKLAIEGNKALEQEIRAAARRNTLGSAFLLSGPGDRTGAARFLAAALECREADAPCGHCGACRKVMENIHPDVITVEDPEHKMIAVDVLRRVRSDAYILPNEGRRKVYLFPDCGRLDAKSQNVLLKVVEEGPEHAAFVFCAENREAVLPTIRSRCVELRLTCEEEEPEETDSHVHTLCSLFFAGDSLGLTSCLTRLEGEKVTREQLQTILTQAWEQVSQAVLAASGCGGVPVNTRLTRRQLMAAGDIFRKYAGQLRFNLGVGHVTGALAVELTRCIRGDMGR